MTEGLIRDYLAVNLDFVEKGLVLVEKEYHLKNAYGANGFIDILAKDPYGNFVVIEIKRSQQSSRQAIQELLKYIALLKQNFHARDSDIRTIIVSTDWGELLVPFSELVHQTTLTVKGIKIDLNSRNEPVNAKLVKPIDTNVIKRNFSPAYWFDLFLTETKRDAIIPFLEEKCRTLGLTDFVILRINANTEPGRHVMYPYATCLAFQSQSITAYLDILKDSDNLDNEPDDFDSEEEYKFYLEEVLQCELLDPEMNDSGDVGSPQKLDAELAIENWHINGVHKYGTFAKDPRYDDDLLINELRGLHGNNPHKFLNVCESTHKHRLSEIFEGCQVTLQDNPDWKKHIGQVFDYLQSKSTPYRLIISIYSPPSVFDGLLRTIMGLEHDYLPVYRIYADFIETGELLIFSGHLAWDGEMPDFQKTVAFLENQRGVFMTKFIDCTSGYHDIKIMQLFHLKYQHVLARVKNDELQEESAIQFKDGGMKNVTLKSHAVFDWIAANEELSAVMLIMASTQVFGYGN